MLSQEMMGAIDQRLREISGKNDLDAGWFSIILVGDQAQLSPVAASPLYRIDPSNQICQKGYLLYQKFQVVIELDESMRQRIDINDLEKMNFINLLKRTRNGENTIEDWELLLRRESNPINIIGSEDAIRLFTDNASVDKYNNEKLTELKLPIVKLQA